MVPVVIKDQFYKTLLILIVICDMIIKQILVLILIQIQMFEG